MTVIVGKNLFVKQRQDTSEERDDLAHYEEPRQTFAEGKMGL